jgi:C_GCAxxG_C_C family probable redox protein
MRRVEEAVSCLKEGFSCYQAVLSAYGTESGLDREIALKVSGAFGGGMGRMGGTCGAVTGAFMVIGLKYGKTKAEDNQTREKAYSLVREFVAEFERRNGSIICRELIGGDIGTAEGMKTARNVCPKLVTDAAEIIERLLE